MAKATRFLKVRPTRDGFRWHLVVSGRIVAESGEAYTRRADAVKAARNVFASDFPIVLVNNGEAERIR